ncbi:MAG: redoxin domain-containing protein, partial [Ketobacteraceae bacterium]|nr:redoxin domain-containing protein [Ketobacteraceae bacterium]
MAGLKWVVFMSRKATGDVVSFANIKNIYGEPAGPTAEGKLVHLQFRRFYGCPICNLHLQSFIKRKDELLNSNVHEIIVFHTSQQKMLENVSDRTFDFVADPDRKLYKSYGVEPTWRALFSIGALKNAVKGVREFGVAMAPSLEAEFGVPADFLIDESGKILALKYGTHADDQWTIDEVLDMAHTVADGGAV